MKLLDNAISVNKQFYFFISAKINNTVGWPDQKQPMSAIKIADTKAA